jgi:hypothetical protein
MDGSLRVCTTAGGQEIHERINDVSDDGRSFRFAHGRVPLPVRRSGGTFTVGPGAPAGSASVILETTFEPIDPTTADRLTAGMRDAFRRSLESLCRYVEEKVTGTPDDAQRLR